MFGFKLKRPNNSVIVWICKPIFILRTTLLRLTNFFTFLKEPGTSKLLTLCDRKDCTWLTFTRLLLDIFGLFLYIVVFCSHLVTIIGFVLRLFCSKVLWGGFQVVLMTSSSRPTDKPCSTTNQCRT